MKKNNSLGVLPSAGITNFGHSVIAGILQMLFASALTVATASAAPTLEVLHSFQQSDGAEPRGKLMQASDGNIYGTTGSGGLINAGTIFRLDLAGGFTSLLQVDGSFGVYPFSGLVQGVDGQLYGTTYYYYTEDSAGYGVIYSLDFQGVVGNRWRFTGEQNGGIYPYPGLVRASDGSLVGLTVSGGNSGKGTVFRLSNDGILTTLNSFDGSNGAFPQEALVQGKDGNFYGTTPAGGIIGPNNSGYGTVFKVSPSGELTTVFAFDGNNGAYPNASLVQAADGNFYGITDAGSPYGRDVYFDGYGTIFKVSPAGQLTTLVAFDRDDRGYNSFSKLIQASDGNFYGVTPQGGPNNSGTVFKMAPDGQITTLVSFSGIDGALPCGGLLEASDGNLYGATLTGGAYGYGTLYRVVMPRPQIAFTGFLAPLGGSDATGGSAASPLRTFKNGSTIPVKFTATLNSTPLLTGVQKLQALRFSNTTVAGTPIDATPQDAATSGNEFRLASGVWQFNLDTKATGMNVGIWQLIATLSDGSKHSCWIQLK